MKRAVLNYAGTSELHYRVPFAEIRTEDMVEDMMPPPYMCRQLRSSYIQFVWSGRLVEKNADMFPLPNLLIKDFDNEEELLYWIRTGRIRLLPERASLFC